MRMAQESSDSVRLFPTNRHRRRLSPRPFARAPPRPALMRGGPQRRAQKSKAVTIGYGERRLRLLFNSGQTDASVRRNDRQQVGMTNWMTLLELVTRPWRRNTPSSKRPAAVFPMEPSMSLVPAEYLSLYTYLERRYASIVVLTFEQMEALLGFALPAAACTERDWWTGAPLLTNRYSEAWIGAGRTAMPNFSARTVTFERT